MQVVLKLAPVCLDPTTWGISRGILKITAVAITGSSKCVMWKTQNQVLIQGPERSLLIHLFTREVSRKEFIREVSRKTETNEQAENGSVQF